MNTSLKHCHKEVPNKTKRVVCLLILLIAAIGCKTRYPSQTSTDTTPVDKSTERPPLVWTYTLPSNTNIYYALIDADVAYYCMSPENSPRGQKGIQAYDLKQQNIIWTVWNTTCQYLLYGAGKLFLISQEEDVKGKITALDSKNGTEVWTVPIPGIRYDEYEITYGDNLLYIGYGNNIFGLNANNGVISWQTEIQPNLSINTAWLGNTYVYSDYGALSYYEGDLYIRLFEYHIDQKTIEGQYLVLGSQNGAEKWKKVFSLPAPSESQPFAVASRPAFEGQTMFFIDWSGQSYLISTDSGETIWMTETFYPGSQPIFVDNQVYFASPYKLVGLDADTGNEIWNTTLPPKLMLTSPLHIFKNAIFTIADNRETHYVELIQVDQKTGNVINRSQLFTTSNCGSCVLAMGVDGEFLAVILQHSIVRINLLQ